jgi:hypothetical protein
MPAALAGATQQNVRFSRKRIRMISSSRVVWIITVLLLAYGAYTSWLAFSHGTGWFLLWSSACFIAAAGLLFSKPWSRYFVYLVALCTVFGWAIFVALMALNGWPYAIRGTLFVAAHGALIVATCVALVIYVHKHFRRAAQRT